MSEDLGKLEQSLRSNLRIIKDLKVLLKFKKLQPVIEELRLNINSLAVLDEAVKQTVITAPTPDDITRIAQELITGEISKSTLALTRLPRLIVNPNALVSVASGSIVQASTVLPSAGVSTGVGGFAPVPILSEGNNNTLSDTVNKVLRDINVPTEIRTSINTSVDILKSNLATAYVFNNTRPVQLSKESQALGEQASNLEKRASGISTQIDALQNRYNTITNTTALDQFREQILELEAQIAALDKERNNVLVESQQMRARQTQIAQQVVREFGSTPSAFLSLNIAGLGKAIADEAVSSGIPVGDYINTLRRKSIKLGRPIQPFERYTPDEALAEIEPFNRLAIAINKINDKVIATATDRGVVVVPTAIYSIPNIDTAKIIAQTRPII